MPRSPKRAIASGWGGGLSSGASTEGTIAVASCSERAEQAPVGGSVGRPASPPSARPIPRRRLPARRPAGWAKATSGVLSETPRGRPGERTAKRRAADARSSRRRGRSPAASAPRSDSRRRRSGRPHIPPRPSRRGPRSGRPRGRLAPSRRSRHRGDCAQPPPRLRSQLDHGALHRERHALRRQRGGPPARSSAASVRSGRWWKSNTARAPARRPSSTAYSAAACPKRPSDASSSPGQLGVVDQQVGPRCKLERGRVVLAAAVLAPRPSAVGQWSGM